MQVPASPMAMHVGEAHGHTVSAGAHFDLSLGVVIATHCPSAEHPASIANAQVSASSPRFRQSSVVPHDDGMIAS